MFDVPRGQYDLSSEEWVVQILIVEHESVPKGIGDEAIMIGLRGVLGRLGIPDSSFPVDAMLNEAS